VYINTKRAGTRRPGSEEKKRVRSKLGKKERREE
jgi:hypothetical protein